MSGIHHLIMNKLKEHLQVVMIDNVSDTTKAGIVYLGPLQGDPDPDQARISITIHENDPDQFLSGAPTSQGRRWWDDDVDMVEIGGVITQTRRFIIKTRCFFEMTRENLDESREITSIVRSRLEHTLPIIDFSGVSIDGEYVSRGIMSKDLYSEMIQFGGPPDSYDYLIKVQFSLLTTSTLR